MAIGLDGYSKVVGSGSGPFTLNHSCGGVQRLLVVVFTGMDNVLTGWSVNGVTYNGVALTAQAAAQQAGNNRNVRTEVWTLVNPPAGSAYTVSVAVSVGLASCSLAVMSLTGVDQTTPTGNVGTDAGNKTSFSASVTTGVADAWLIGGAGVRNGTLSWTPGAGVTEIDEQSSGSNTTDDVAGMWGYRVCTAAGSYAFAGSVGSANHGVLGAVEVRPAAVAPAAWFGAEVLEPVAGMWMF